jgi:hypothetical protein
MTDWMFTPSFKDCDGTDLPAELALILRAELMLINRISREIDKTAGVIRTDGYHQQAARIIINLVRQHDAEQKK